MTILAVIAFVPVILAMIVLLRLAKTNRAFAAAAMAVAALFMPIPDPPPKHLTEDLETDKEQDRKGDPPEL